MDYLTQEKYDEFVKELDYLKKTRRKEVAEALEYAKSLGDLSENAEYHEARDTQAMVEDRISHLESIIKTAKIVSNHETSMVSVGSEVSVKKDGAGEEKVYVIVGAEEANISTGKISVISPLGEALMGKKKGELVSFKTPSGEAKYKIVGIK
jgi:transcription elongation factor GreA